MDNFVEATCTRLKEFSYLFLEHHFLYILLKWENSIYYLRFLILIHSSKHCNLVSTHNYSLTTLAVAAYLLNSKTFFTWVPFCFVYHFFFLFTHFGVLFSWLPRWCFLLIFLLPSDNFISFFVCGYFIICPWHRGHFS